MSTSNAQTATANDPYTRMSFVRAAFHDSGQGMPSLEVLHCKLAERSAGASGWGGTSTRLSGVVWR